MKFKYGQLINKIDTFSSKLGGVFTYSDLVNLIGRETELNNIRIINRLIKDNIIYKIQKGFYITKNANLELLACRLKKNAYLSMDTVLAKTALIGTNPERSVTVVYPGIKKQLIETPIGIIRYFSIQKPLMFGFEQDILCIRRADKEKAFLDMMYFYMKGAKFVIDPTQEIDVTKLNIAKTEKYLKAYKNKKFVTFIKRMLHESRN